jgi:hypothetical protein
MKSDAGVFLGDRNQVAIFKNSDLWLLEAGKASAIPIEYQREPRFLSACPNGIYLAFWSFTGESFRLIDITGNQLWSAWMNSDKAVPQGIHFSTLGDAVACFFHFDGLPGMFFCDINDGFSTTFGCSGNPIGFDAGLQYFAIDSCDPFEDEKLAFFEKEPGTGSPIKIPPQMVSQMLKQNPLLVDRNRCILKKPVLPMRDWQGLAIQNNLAGFVILKDCNLYWFNRDSDKPETVCERCIPEDDRYRSHSTRLHLNGDNALIRIGDHSVVVNRHHGVIFKGTNLSSTTIRGSRVLAHYNDGSVGVIRKDGSIEMECPPPRGFQVLAADIIDRLLTIACAAEMSGNIIFKTFLLENRD